MNGEYRAGSLADARRLIVDPPSKHVFNSRVFIGTISRFINALFIAVVIALATPGSHRAVLPGVFGLTEIAPRIWSDAPQNAGAYRGLVANARRNVAAFFGTANNPVIILCSTQTCAQRFAIRGNGASVGPYAVLVSPGGLTLGTLTHELIHSRLHRSMGLRNLIRQPYPTWFDEGLATYVADHPKWGGPVTEAARARVRRVLRFWDWADTYRAIGAGLAYRAAAAEVAAIEAHAGRDGLLELITRAEQGEDFDTILAQIMARSP